MTDIRTTREAVEVLASLETVIDVYVTREAIEVLTSYSEAPPKRRMITVTYTDLI